MKKQQLKAGLASVLVGMMSPLAVIAPQARAATVTWAGGDSASMNSGTNWVGGGILVNGDTAVFPTSGLYQMPNNDISSLSLVKIIFNGAKSGTSSKDYTISGNPITITEGIDAVMTGAGGNHAIETDVTLGADATFTTSGSNSLSIGDTDKTLALGANDLTLNAGGGTITLLGKITGTGSITKSGTGNVKILATPGTGGFTGSLAVSAGETTVEQNLGLNVTVSGGKLKGTGTVGDVSMSSGAIAPGLSPGVINTGDLTFTGGTFEAELGGTGAGQFDQTNVTGTVNLGSATTLTVTLVNSFAPAVNNSFVIVNNDSNDAVQGTFSGLANGASVTVGGYTFRVNYDGGDGNDVVLTTTAVPAAPDTGIGSLVTNPMLTIVLAAAVLGTLGVLRRVDARKK